MKTKIAILAIILTACRPYEGAFTQTPNHDGSIEAVISIKHQKDYDLLITHYNIWVNNSLDRKITKTDTLRNLGTTEKLLEDPFGVAEKRTVPKNYSVYITVK